MFTNRRNYIPILSVYFLTLPDTHAQQIGIYMGMCYIGAMIFQMPSGVIADHWGQKNTLILSKVLVFFGTLCYIIADGFWIFALGGILTTIGINAFSSGTTSSFLKGTLEKLGRGDEYKKVASRISGNVSLLSVFFILILPTLTQIDIRLPLYAALVMDAIGVLTAVMLLPVHTHIEKHEKKNIGKLIGELRGTGFFPYAFFVAILSGILFADNAYRSPYLIELGYPLVYIGVVMASSRVVWWLVGRYAFLIEKFVPFQRLILIEIFLFPLYYILAGYISNPWIVGALFSIVIGWFWGRSEIYTDHLIDRIPDVRYRATALSLKAQIQNIIEMSVSFGIAGVMGISYALGFQVLGIVLFLSLISVYWFGMRNLQ